MTNPPRQLPAQLPSNQLVNGLATRWALRFLPIFYDREYLLSISLANLDCCHFANKTTCVQVEPGPLA